MCNHHGTSVHARTSSPTTRPTLWIRLGRPCGVSFVDDHRVRCWDRSTRQVPRKVSLHHYGSGVLQHCHIIVDSEPDTWDDLKERHWIPSGAKDVPRHEPRDGVLMCKNHHGGFNSYAFFIRFFPDIGKFVFINYSGHPNLQQFHGKAVALDIKDKYAPFPSLFIIHEMRVRGFHPFRPIVPTIPDGIPWQDWMLSDHVFDNTSDSFKRNRPPPNRNNSVSAQIQLPFHPTTTSPDGASSQRTLALNADVVTDILAATHAMPSWKACQVEGTSWSGTAEENIEKYVSSIGV